MKKIQPWETDDLLNEWSEKGIPKTWEEVTDFNEYGLGWVMFEGEFAFVDKEGNLIISPGEYRHIYFPFFEKGYATASKEGKFGVINYKNEIVIPFKYDDLMSNFSDEKCLFSAILDGKSAIIDIEENIIFPYSDFRIHEFNQNFIIVSKEEKFGLIDFQGNFIIPFKWDNLSFVEENLCAGKTTDVFFNKEFLDDFGICSYTFPKCFTKDFQKIVYGIIDEKENELFPFISDTPIFLFNPENGRAKISLNTWEHLDKKSEDLSYVAENTGEKVPFLSHYIEDNEQRNHFLKMCEELIFGKIIHEDWYS